MAQHTRTDDIDTRSAASAGSAPAGWVTPWPQRLLDAGRDVAVWNRTRAKAEDLAELRRAPSSTRVAELADRDVVFTMVAADADLLAGDARRRRAAHARTAAPRDRHRLEHRLGGDLGAASGRPRRRAARCSWPRPVSGNAKVVKAGQAVHRRVRPARGVRQHRAAARPHRGTQSPTSARARWPGWSSWRTTSSSASSPSRWPRSLCWPSSGGVSRADFLGVPQRRSVMGSTFTRYKSPALVNLDLTPTFTTTLLRKDFDLGLAAARRLDVPMPLAAATASAGAGGHRSRPRRRGLRDTARRAGGNAGLELEPENVEVDDGLSGVSGR